MRSDTRSSRIISVKIADSLYSVRLRDVSPSGLKSGAPLNYARGDQFGMLLGLLRMLRNSGLTAWELIPDAR